MKDSPFLRIDGVRCYLGVPMVTSRGFIIGSFCAFGTEARVFDFEDLTYMRQLAAEVVRELELAAGRELIRRTQGMAKLT